MRLLAARALLPLAFFCVTCAAWAVTTAQDPDRARLAIDALVNPSVDGPGFLRYASQAATHREERLVSEDEFLRLSRLPGTVILDARSRPMYDRLHVRGAINLSFPDITVASLEAALPDRATRILIYCNNNFTGAPDPFPSKLPASALNLSTYTTLYIYGYRNVYELAPLLDVRTTRIPFDPPVR